MNKITRLLTVPLAVAVLFCGCNVKTAGKSQSGSGTAGIDNVGGSVNQLVWVTDSDAMYEDQKVYDRLNELLAQKGCGFTVKLVGVTHDEYANTLKKMKSANEQADILMSAIGYEGDENQDSGYSSYYDDVKSGYFEPLDARFDTAQGKKLYDSGDSKMWSGLKVNGKIYGVRDFANIADGYSWKFNKALLQKYHIDTSRLSNNLCDMAEILKTVYDGEKNTPGFAALYLPAGADQITCLYDTLTKCVGVADTDESGKAVNLFAQDSTLQYIKTVRQFNEAGYMKGSADGVSTSSDGIIRSFFMTTGWHAAGNESDENTAKLDLSGKIVTVNTVFKPLEDCYVKSLSFRFAVTGIASWSNDKDSAFRLLALSYTDAQISDLLRYGLEGVNYTMKDGRPVSKDESGGVNLISDMCFGNALISYPGGINGVKKGVDYSAAYKKVPSSPILGFHFDETAVKKEVSATDSVLDKYSDDLWMGNASDAQIASFLSELKTAGIDKIVNEANRQISAWKNLK